MKTSNKILLVAAAIPVLLFIGVSIFLKVAFENSVYSDVEGFDPEKLISKEYDFKGCNKLFFNGAWDIKIVKGSDCHVEISAPETVINFISVQNIGNELFLNQLSGDLKSDDGYALKVEITIPAATDIVLTGACRLNVSDFVQDSLAIDANGAIQLSISNANLTDLDLKGKGVAEWDLSKASVVNAHVDYDGKFSIALYINGGKLSGVLDGVGTLTYTGEADTIDMKMKNPLSKIVHQKVL